METIPYIDLSAAPSNLITSAMCNRTSTFARLAPEIIELIAYHLHRSDILSLRLSCVELEHKTFHYFTHNCFKVIHTDFSRKSLEKMKELSRNEEIKRHVRSMVLVAPYSPWPDTKQAFGAGFKWSRSYRGELDYPLSAAELLGDILCSFVNCRSFELSRTSQSSGCVQQSLNRHPDTLAPMEAIALLQTIVAQRDLVMKSFDLKLTPSDMDFIPKLYGQIPSSAPLFRNAWIHLEELVLEPNRYIKGASKVCADLIATAQNLRKLTITLTQIWDLSKLMDKVCFKDISPYLEELHFNSGVVEEDSLKKLLTLVGSSLRKISFSGVYLYRGMWKSILREIRTLLPNLETITLYHLTQTRTLFENHSFSDRVTILTFPALSHGFAASQTLVAAGGRFEVSSRSESPELREYTNLIGCRYRGAGIGPALEIIANSIVEGDERFALCDLRERDNGIEILK